MSPTRSGEPQGCPRTGLEHRRRTMWRMSNAQALIFVAAIVIAVAMLVLLA
jgi:hypothetical protein